MENDEQNAFAEAQQAEALRQQITQRAANAVKYGKVDRDWVNAQLTRLGAEPVTGNAEYRINVPVNGVFGKTIKAASRAEALAIFAQHVARVAVARQITDGYHCDAVYQVEFSNQVPTFFSGPEDVTPVEVDKMPGLDALKAGIRQMLKEGITRHGWGHSDAVGALAAVGLEPLPPLECRSVHVPVSGTAQMTVYVFEGDGDEAAQAAAASLVRRMKQVAVTADEVGTAFLSRSGLSETMGLTLMDDDE